MDDHHRQEQALPILEQRTVVLMKQREAQLKESYSSLLSIPTLKSSVLKYIRLRVSREFSLPDSAVVVLVNTCSYVPYAATETTDNDEDEGEEEDVYDVANGNNININNSSSQNMAPSSGVLSCLGSNVSELQGHQDIYGSVPSVPPLPVPLRGETPVPPPLPPFSFHNKSRGQSAMVPPGVAHPPPDRQVASYPEDFLTMMPQECLQVSPRHPSETSSLMPFCLMQESRDDEARLLGQGFLEDFLRNHPPSSPMMAMPDVTTSSSRPPAKRSALAPSSLEAASLVPPARPTTRIPRQQQES
jgi:hypothetical protein